MPPAEAPAKNEARYQVVLKDASSQAKAVEALKAMKCVTQVEVESEGHLLVTAKKDTAKAVTAALKKAGIKAEVTEKKA